MSRKWDESDKPIRCVDCRHFFKATSFCKEKSFEVTNTHGWRYCYLGEPRDFRQRSESKKEEY